jgi:hypothetical protein
LAVLLGRTRYLDPLVIPNELVLVDHRFEVLLDLLEVDVFVSGSLDVNILC